VGGQRHAPAALPLAQRTVTHRNGCWVGPSQQPNNEYLQDANGHPATGSGHGTAPSVPRLAAGQSPTIDLRQATKAANRQSTPSSGLRQSAGERLSASSHLAAGYRLSSHQWTEAHELKSVSWRPRNSSSPAVSGQQLS